MPRKNLKTVRTEEYSRAAFELLCEHGVSGTTVDKVAAVAGVSKTNVLHYFGNKTKLLEMALRYGNADLASEVRELLRRSNTPWERVYSVIFANFSKQYFTPKLAHAWLSLCAEVPHHESYQRIQTAIHRRMRSNLVHALSKITDADIAEQASLSISVLIDGLWIRCGLQNDGISRETALSLIDAHLNALFPEDEGRESARQRLEDICEILHP